MSNKTLIYIAGPTGVGKTKLSLNLTKKFKTEIISCDSRQFYKEMTIGTAVPDSEELAAATHHFIQNKYSTIIFTTTLNLFKETVTIIRAISTNHFRITRASTRL